MEDRDHARASGVIVRDQQEITKRHVMEHNLSCS